MTAVVLDEQGHVNVGELAHVRPVPERLPSDWMRAMRCVTALQTLLHFHTSTNAASATPILIVQGFTAAGKGSLIAKAKALGLRKLKLLEQWRHARGQMRTSLLQMRGKHRRIEGIE